MVEIEEIEDASVEEVRVPVVCMRCNGECIERMASASVQAVARIAAELVLALAGLHLPFNLLSLVTWAQLDLTSDASLDGGEAFAVLLEGANFHVSPLSTGVAYQQQLGKQNLANLEWQQKGVAQRAGTREDVFRLATRISMGGSLAPPTMPRSIGDEGASGARESTEPLRVGTYATVAGLAGRVALNGQKVKLLKFDGGKQRWAVQVVESRERVLVQAKNLKTPRVVDAGGAGGVGGFLPEPIPAAQEHRLYDEYDEDPPSQEEEDDDESEESEPSQDVPDSALDARGAAADSGIAAMQL